MVPTPTLEPGAVQEFYQHTKVPEWQIRRQKWEIQQENGTARSEQSSFCSSVTQSRKKQGWDLQKPNFSLNFFPEMPLNAPTKGFKFSPPSPGVGTFPWHRFWAALSPHKDPPAVGFGVTPFPAGMQVAPVTDHGHKKGITRMVWEISH